MPDDGWTMRKGELCLVTDYMQSSFTEYWEGKRLRENLNLGKFTSKVIMPMIGYGITDKLTAFAGVPHIDNSSDAGTMTGQKGWQDLSLHLKYLLLNKNAGKWDYKLFATGGVSFPISDYPPDFLPYSIGLGTTNIDTRMVGHSCSVRSGLLQCRQVTYSKVTSRLIGNLITLMNNITVMKWPCQTCEWIS
jgi:hypothetical protein